MADAKRDANRVTTLLGVSNIDGLTPVTLYADPSTHELLIQGALTVAGVATADNQTDGSQKTQIVDGSGNVIASTTNALNVSVRNSSLAVTGTFWQSTQPVSIAQDIMLGTDFSSVFGAASLISATPAIKVEEQGTITVDCNSSDVTIANASIAVTGTFWQSTQPVSLASVPSHAVTNAGTFVVQEDGAALTALQLIDDVVYTDDTAVHATGASKGIGIMAAATPTDGSVSANDIGMVGMSLDRRLHVDAQIVGTDVALDCSGATITVSGTVTANLGATDNAVLDAIALGFGTEGDALADGVLIQGDDGTDRTNVLVDAAGHLQVDVLSAPTIAVTGTFWQSTQPVSLTSVPSHEVTNAGTFAVQPGAALTGPGNPTIDSYTHAAINLVAGANQVLVASAANKQIWVYGIGFVVNVAGTVSFQDEDDLAITGVMPFAANSGMAIPPSGNFAMPIWKLGTDKDLEVDIVTAEMDGWIVYAIVSV